MATDAPRNMQPPQEPSTPVVAQQALNELIDYYRQLADYHHSSVNYHQQLVERHSSEIALVEKQLASVEALLNPLTESASTENGMSDRQLDEEKTVSPDSTSPPEATATKESEPEIAHLADEATEPVARSAAETDNVDANGKTGDTESSTVAATETEAVSDRQKAKPNSTKTTKTKAKAKATRDNKKKSSKAKKSYSSRLPNSPLLETYETINDAVAGCLQEHYPQVMSADEVLKYYYPEGLSGATKKRAYGAFSNTLSKGAGNKGWIRESIGKYRWREGI